jgi:hypothetical protein
MTLVETAVYQERVGVASDHALGGVEQDRSTAEVDFRV